MTPCYYNRFAIVGAACPNEGRWRSQRARAGIRGMTWCDEHKHEGDVPILSSPASVASVKVR